MSIICLKRSKKGNRRPEAPKPAQAAIPPIPPLPGTCDVIEYHLRFILAIKNHYFIDVATIQPFMLWEPIHLLFLVDVLMLLPYIAYSYKPKLQPKNLPMF